MPSPCGCVCTRDGHPSSSDPPRSRGPRTGAARSALTRSGSSSGSTPAAGRGRASAASGSRRSRRCSSAFETARASGSSCPRAATHHAKASRSASSRRSRSTTRWSAAWCIGATDRPWTAFGRSIRRVPLGTLWSAGPARFALPPPGEAEAVCSAVEVLGAADVEAIRAAGLGCYVWTVDEPALADRLIGWRVDGIVTGPARAGTSPNRPAVVGVS